MGEEVSGLIKAKEMERLSHVSWKGRTTTVKVGK